MFSLNLSRFHYSYVKGEKLYPTAVMKVKCTNLYESPSQPSSKLLNFF